MKTITFLLGASLALNFASGVPTVNRPLTPTPPKSGVSPFANITAPTCTTVDDVKHVKNGMIDPRYRWTNFNVHPDINYDGNEQQAINDAMYNLMQIIPCVQFGIWPPNSNPTGDFVHVVKGTGNGCSSYVGRIGGRQDMNLQSPGCMSIGTIMHEMIHALGFQHEQCRPDRDDYINVLYENIQGGMAYNFDKFPDSQVTTYGVPYNVRSIMHYDSYAFSANGQPTMLAKNGEQIGSTGNLEGTDIAKLKAMYGC
ncbi:Zinc metalloproteinase nas-14 [Orchesella cincta]|uniref:Metalloendopeptidase n=1 Tax=Orchesella cincta TaxID=48709 RepID=A0A1D2MUM3_ORCCI|nr:Zinc metalloproteinase nas-14 [Orchesella cincta]